MQDSSSPTPPTIQQDQVEAVAEGEVVSRWEAPRRIQVDHPPSRIIGDCWYLLSLQKYYDG
jgi:hypothetical protein